MLLALDPGLNSPGIAVFNGSTLVFADRVTVPEYALSSEGARWFMVAAQIVDALLRRGEDDLITEIVFEKPQVYSERQGKSKGDPNQLIAVAGVAANVCGMLVRNNPTIYSPTPAEWIGQVPKVCPSCNGRKTVGGKGKGSRAKFYCSECRGSAWGTPRGRRIRSRLTDAEIALVPDQNDAIDAVGIGLHRRGRLEKVSVFTNGRDGR